MSYRLIITSPDGSQHQSSPEPLSDRGTVGLAAMRALGSGGCSIGDGKALGRQVRDAAIGETVTHAPTGYRFRIEPF